MSGFDFTQTFNRYPGPGPIYLFLKRGVKAFKQSFGYLGAFVPRKGKDVVNKAVG